MTAPDRPGTPQALAHGQAEYERSAREAEPWHAPLPAWGELLPGEQAGWRLIESQLTLGRRSHCFCEGGPRLTGWSAALLAWVHADGHPCPDSASRPAPSGAAQVLF